MRRVRTALWRSLIVVCTTWWVAAVLTAFPVLVSSAPAEPVFWGLGGGSLLLAAWGVMVGLALFTERPVYGAVAYLIAAVLLLVPAAVLSDQARWSGAEGALCCVIAGIGRLFDERGDDGVGAQARAVAVGVLGVAAYDAFGLGIVTVPLVALACFLLGRSCTPFDRSNPFARSGVVVGAVGLLVVGALASVGRSVGVASAAYTASAAGLYAAVRWHVPRVDASLRGVEADATAFGVQAPVCSDRGLQAGDQPQPPRIGA